MHDVTAVILCGGAGRRMGGLDKPLIEHHGQRLVERICAALAPVVSGVLISANRNLKDYERYAPTLPDQVPGRGPLEGIATALAHAATPWAFICPGDAPNIEVAVPQRLRRAAAANTGAVVAHDGERRQQLHMLVRTDRSHSMRAYLDGGDRSVHGWLSQQEVVEVQMADLAASFGDLDAPGDLD